MNNKKLGSQFEKDMCQLLAAKGWWTHFITPAADGGQPFDIIAVKNGYPLAIDCKTSVDPIFRIDRLEENQKMAFNLWMNRANNDDPRIAVKYDGKIYLLSYRRLMKYGKIDLREEQPFA